MQQVIPKIGLIQNKIGNRPSSRKMMPVLASGLEPVVSAYVQYKFGQNTDKCLSVASLMLLVHYTYRLRPRNYRLWIDWCDIWRYVAMHHIKVYTFLVLSRLLRF